MMVLKEGLYTGNLQHRLDLDGAIISLAEYRKSDSKWHCHENFHASYVFQGNPSVRKHAFQDRSLTRIHIYESGERHRFLTSTSTTKSINIELADSFLKKYELAEDDLAQAMRSNWNSKLIMIKLLNEMINQDHLSMSSIRSLLLNLFHADFDLKQGIPSWVKRLESLLEDQWNKNLSLHEIGETLSIHPVTISRYFPKYFGVTLGDYRRRLAIQRSIALIKNTDQSLTEVAHFCNFSDQSHFIRNFKRYTGFLPKQFRKV